MKISLWTCESSTVNVNWRNSVSAHKSYATAKGHLPVFTPHYVRKVGTQEDLPIGFIAVCSL